MYKVYYLQYVDDIYGKHVDYSWEEYSGITWGSELDAMDEYTKARMEGYTCMIKEV